jgi:hypothetical protein
MYVTRGCDKPQAIVLIGFDPAIKLVGLKRRGALCNKGVGEGPHIDGRATGYVDRRQEWKVGKENQYLNVGEADKTVTRKSRLTRLTLFLSPSLVDLRPI